jgi:Flp pilus assembly secretin CpaC
LVLAGCFVLAAFCEVASAQTQPPQPASGGVQAEQEQVGQDRAAAPESGTAQAQSTDGGDGVVAAGLASAHATTDRHKVREAESAYLAGANKLERDDLDAAESEFKRALALDPGNRDYAIAISVTRQHRVTELVQQAGKARRVGEDAKAETLGAEARTIDPDNPIVIEHSGPVFVRGGDGAQAAWGAAGASARASTGSSRAAASPASRATMLSGGAARESWRVEVPELSGVLQVEPTPELQSFHVRGDSEDLIRIVSSAYGIHAVFDDSVQHRNVRIDLDNAPYRQAMDIVGSITQVFAVPLDEKSVLVARDTVENRTRLEHQVEETIYVPASTPEQIADLTAVMRNIFDIGQVSIQASSNSIVVHAPERVLAVMNRTVQDLMDATGEVMVEVKMYEVDTTRMTSLGATIPTQAGIYNVEQAATQLVSANQAIVQQAIAQGFISSTASDIDIALALIGSGLVQSSMLSSTIGFFGKGLTETGITASTNTAFNTGLNSSDTRALDDVQVRVTDRQPAILREGTRYPITTSTYTTGLSTAASALGNATINGVSVSSLLQQYSGGTSTTIPQVTYEDLGVTLNATPTIEKSGRVNLLLNLKIEALAGGSTNGMPVLENRAFVSDITVGDGESAMMVSNVNRTETAAMTGIPGLSELPGFQMPISENTEKDASQLVVVVTPHVVRRRSDVFAGPPMLIKIIPGLPGAPVQVR